MKARKYWALGIIVFIILAFLLGFIAGQQYVPEDIYRVEVSIDDAARNPDKIDEVFLSHAELCKALYRPPTNFIDAAMEIQPALHRVKEAEKSLSF
ncbi:hypothetical protein ACFL1G_09565 [Planctomycetota bacterium]